MTPERKFDKKKRNIESRKPKPVILIVAEGENVTETQYFKSFQNQNASCNIRLTLAKHITDPEGMLKAIQTRWKDLGLDARKGDRAYVVLDLDCDDNKAKLIKTIQRKAKETRFIISNPCFEVWFLLHFKYSTKQFVNSDNVLKDLKTYIPGYKKNLDVSGKIEPLREQAIANSEKLREYFVELGYEWPSNACNPYTDVDILMKRIKKEKEGGH